ncbi:MAG: BTAD domain-containing putative transcriptional regulator [Actinomycetota bacterium]
MSRLSLRLLGSPRIERDGVALRVDTRKATALLVYLAVTDDEHSRDSLALLLWPDYDEARARAALRRTLSVLHKGLAGTSLRIDRAKIALEREYLWLDVALFRQLLAGCAEHRSGGPSKGCASCAEALTEAVELYRGDLLTGFTLRDSAPFDDWQIFHAEELRRELAAGLSTLVASLADSGDFARAIHYATRWVALNPLQEAAHQELMKLFTGRGERSAALRQYRECVAVLERELGVPPLEATTELYHAIEQERLATRTRPQPATTAPHPRRADQGGVRDLPLVGRGPEMAGLGTAHGDLASGGRLVVVEGEPGIGKTRLVEEFVARLGARGSTVLRARCRRDGASLAYGVVADLLQDSLSNAEAVERIAGLPQHWVIEAARLVPDLFERDRGSRPADPPKGPSLKAGS